MARKSKLAVATKPSIATATGRVLGQLSAIEDMLYS